MAGKHGGGGPGRKRARMPNGETPGGSGAVSNVGKTAGRRRRSSRRNADGAMPEAGDNADGSPPRSRAEAAEAAVGAAMGMRALLRRGDGVADGTTTVAAAATAAAARRVTSRDRRRTLLKDGGGGEGEGEEGKSEGEDDLRRLVSLNRVDLGLHAVAKVQTTRDASEAHDARHCQRLAR